MMSDITRFWRAVIDLRLACDHELKALAAGYPPAGDLVIMVAAGELGLAYDAYLQPDAVDEWDAEVTRQAQRDADNGRRYD